MTDKRPICVKCETSMRPERNGVVVRYSHDSFQRGDLYKCPICGNEIITGFGQKFYNWGINKEGKYQKYVVRYDYKRRQT